MHFLFILFIPFMPMRVYLLSHAYLARNCIQDVGFSVEFLDASRTKRPMLPYQRYESHQVLQFSFIQICKVSSLGEISFHLDREGTNSAFICLLSLRVANRIFGNILVSKSL